MQLLSKSTSDITTAWIPLDGLTEQWGLFGTESTTASACHATSIAFAAIASEAEAYEHYTEGLCTPLGANVAALENALNALMKTRQYWTEAMLALQLLLLGARNSALLEEAIQTLIMQIAEQRMRVSKLICEVEQEQLVSRKTSSVH